MISEFLITLINDPSREIFMPRATRQISACLIKTITSLALILSITTTARAADNPACVIWPEIARSATLGQVEAFLTECRSGIFHRLAKARLSELKGETVHTKAPPKPDFANVEDSTEPAEDLYQRAKDYQYGDRELPKDYKKAMRLFLQAAKKGHAKSMTDIGYMHEKGFGTQKNSEEAFKWYERAAEKGESMALNNLGWMYSQGRAVERDYVKAVRLYRRAIALGEPLAMTNLGWMYETGKGVEQDNSKAFGYYKQAADAGDLQGLHNSGWMYASGRGTKRDPAKGADAVYRAIQKGNKFSIDQMTSNYDAWPKDFRREVQKLLKQNGYFNGTTDGVFRQDTIDAVRAAAKK